MKKLKIGIIGCSGRGRNAWFLHKPDDGVEIIAGADVCDISLQEFKNNFPDALIFNDYKKMLAIKDIDAVIISTPVEFHEQMTLESINSKKAVYLEKPMAETISGCDRLIKKAKENNIKLFIGHNLRAYAFLDSLKQVIDSGAIGEVKSIWCRHFVGKGRYSDDFFKQYSKPGFRFGILLHKGSHDIDAIHYLGGSWTKKVVGMGTYSGFDDTGFVEKPELKNLEKQENHNMLLMELANGVQASYLQCHFAPDDLRNYTIIGTMGRIENTGSNYGKSQIHVWSNKNGQTEYSVFETPDRIQKVSTHADITTLNNFLDYVRYESFPIVTVEDARYAVATAILGNQSMRQGCVPLEIPAIEQSIEL